MVKESAFSREFNDACGIAHALELIGERWGLVVLRELMLGARRFSDLKAALPGITPSVLTQRLNEFEQRGLVRKFRMTQPVSAQVYEATPWGLQMEPILQMLGYWALRSPRHDPTKPVNAVSVMLSLKSMIDPQKAQGFRAKIGFEIGDQSFVASVADNRIDVERGETDQCDATLIASAQNIVAVAYIGAPLETLSIEGDLTVAKRFVSIFTLPPKVTA
jgi:DNA-binding HxlR family transcriptional regulator